MNLTPADHTLAAQFSGPVPFEPVRSPMRAFKVSIGKKGSPRLCFEAMAKDSCDVVVQHVDLCESGERMEVVAI